MGKISVICCCCGKYMYSKEDDTLLQDEVSHGLCDEDLEKYFPEIEKPKPLEGNAVKKE